MCIIYTCISSLILSVNNNCQVLTSSIFSRFYRFFRIPYWGSLLQAGVYVLFLLNPATNDIKDSYASRLAKINYYIKSDDIGKIS